MHDVSKLMEEGLDLVVVEQSWLCFRRLGEVRNHQTDAELKNRIDSNKLDFQPIRIYLRTEVINLNYE